MLLGNTNVDKLLAGSFPAVGSESHYRRRSGRNGDNARVVLHALEQVAGCQVCVILRFLATTDNDAGLRIERHCPVVGLLILFSRSVSFSL